MAKIFNRVFCILLLCVGCHNRVSEDGLVFSKDTAAVEKEVVIIDSVPVVVKTATDSIINIAPEVPPQQLKQPGATAPDLQAVYTSQLGVREKTGHNDGVDVEKYLKSVGLGKGYAWCAAFVKWCFTQASVRTPGMNAAAASCLNKNNLVIWKHKTLKELKAGDVCVLWYNALNRIGHTFFYNRTVNVTVYESVEGNTNEAGSREGDGVYKKYRSFNATYAISRWK